MKAKLIKLSIAPFKNKLLYLGMMSLLFISGCGGSGSGSEDTTFINGQTDINVALAINGSSASANYNDIQASKVIDGNTGISESWAGNISEDFVTIDFGKVRSLSRITIYTSDTTFNPNSPNKRIELSTDISNSSNWKTTAQESGGDINCNTLFRTTQTIACSYSTRIDARYIRFTSLTSDLLNVYEIQATGF